MKNTIITAVVIVAIAVSGYFILRDKPTSTSSDDLAKVEDTVKMEDGTAPTSSKKMAFSQFVNQGGTYKCTVTQYVGETSTQGTVYIDNGKMKGEFKTVADGVNIDSNFVLRDGFMFSWSSMSKMGIKMPIEEKTSVNGSTETSGFNTEQIGDYDCQTWAADSSTFTVPTTITFTQVR